MVYPGVNSEKLQIMREQKLTYMPQLKYLTKRLLESKLLDKEKGSKALAKSVEDFFTDASSININDPTKMYDPQGDGTLRDVLTKLQKAQEKHWKNTKDAYNTDVLPFEESNAWIPWKKLPRARGAHEGPTLMLFQPIDTNIAVYGSKSEIDAVKPILDKKENDGLDVAGRVLFMKKEGKADANSFTDPSNVWAIYASQWETLDNTKGKELDTALEKDFQKQWRVATVKHGAGTSAWYWPDSKGAAPVVYLADTIFPRIFHFRTGRLSSVRLWVG